MQDTIVVSGRSRVVAGLSVALAASAAIPQLFHLLGVSGAVFLPIYTAVLLAALFVHALAAVLVAALTPLVNHLLSGMPAAAPLPMLQILTGELLVLALLLSFLKRMPVPLRLLVALAAARAVGLLFVPFHERVTMDWWLGMLQRGIPGLLIQFAVGYLSWLRFGQER